MSKHKLITLLLTLLTSCATEKKVPNQKYYYVHSSKNNTDFYKDETDCAAKAGQATPGLAHRAIQTNYYGKDLSTQLSARANNQAEQYQYNLLIHQYENIKMRCMLGYGWTLEPLEEYNKKIKDAQFLENE